MNQKKTIIILIFILLVGIVGLTIAYFSNTTSINNLFSTNPYGTTVEEVFTSPSNWLPGTTTDKQIAVTNSGSVDEAVRISYTERWIAKDNTILSGLIDQDGNLTSTEENSEHAAIINFSNNGDWIYFNGYYYYNYKLSPNDTTSSLIDSVTFNSKTKNSSNCITTENNGVKSITCNSTNSGYDGATYTLTFIIETVQYDKYMNAWNTDVAILNEQSLFCDAFEVGEVVTYNNADYYVLKDSSTSDDYLTLLKKDPLTASEVNQYSDGYVSQDGEYPYYESDTCYWTYTPTYGGNLAGCTTIYDESNVKIILDNWSSSFSDDLVSVNGYKIRLITDDEIFSNLNYIVYNSTPTDIGYKVSSNTPNWSYIDSKQYWSMSQYEDYNNMMISVSNELSSISVFKKNYIRPVINLKKDVINGACNASLNSKYLSCNIGDEVIYNGDKYFAINESNNNLKTVTLLKADPLTASEINQYSDSYVSQDGEYPYYENDICNENTITGCSTNYDTSNLKKIIDGWSNNFSNDLINLNRYKVRLLTENEILNNLNLKKSSYGYEVFTFSSQTPLFAFYGDKKYWTMMIRKIEGSSNLYSYTINTTNNSIISEPNIIYKKEYVRPVINLKKSAIESGCHVDNDSLNNNLLYSNYVVGETVSYNNNDYCVIENSLATQDYVTLIKQLPLTYDELLAYKGDLSTDYFQNSNGRGLSNYYKSNLCYRRNVSDYNFSGCTNNYDTSFVKTVINNWSNSILNDLKEVDGYKVRLLNIDELFENLGYDRNIRGTADQYIETINVPSCLYNVGSYWTMSGLDDDNINMYIINNSGTIDGNRWDNATAGDKSVFYQYAVRPVINLKKCAITNTCE